MTPQHAQTQRTDFDAIVIGSGMTGGWTVKELTELGLHTLVLDAGRPITPERDYQEHKAPFEMPFRGIGDRRLIDARQVGGKSIIWGRQTYRMSDLDFEANLRDGIAVDWPIRYRDIAPWYDRIERFIGVSRRAERLAQLPDGVFQPPMPMNVVEAHGRDRMAAKFGRDRVLTIGRAAVLTQPKPGRGACHYCGPCHRGCSTRSYFSTINATLPAAQATGRMTLRPYSVVRSLAYDAKRHRNSGVHVIDAQSGKALEFTARIVFVGASAIESARPLLNSATPEFANGLANSSDQVGRNIMDHIKWGGASGEFDGWTDKQVIGERPNGIYVPRFRNVHAKHADCIRGYDFQGGAGRSGWQSATRAAGIGLACKARPTQLGPWSMSFNGFGEMLPNGKNRATAHPTLKDRWGNPSLHIECEWSANELALNLDMNVTGVAPRGGQREACAALDARPQHAREREP